VDTALQHIPGCEHALHMRCAVKKNVIGSWQYPHSLISCTQPYTHALSSLSEGRGAATAKWASRQRKQNIYLVQVHCVCQYTSAAHIICRATSITRSTGLLYRPVVGCVNDSAFTALSVRVRVGISFINYICGWEACMIRYQEAQLPQRERGPRDALYFSWNLVNCCTAVGKNRILQACNKCMTSNVTQGHRKWHVSISLPSY